MSVRYWLPASFSAHDSLPSQSWQFLPEAKALVSLLVWKTTIRDVDRHGFARLHSRWLKKLLGRNYACVINGLLRSHTTERSNYSSGHKSFGYRLAARFQSDAVVSEPVESARIRKRLEAWQASREAVQQARWLPIHHELDRRQRLIRIDRGAALAELEQYPECRLQQSCLVETIARGGHRLSVGTASERVTTSCGLLKRCVRQSALSSAGESLVEVDLKGSQPSLLGMLLSADRRRPFVQSLLHDIELPAFGNLNRPDVKDYLDCVFAGQLYEKVHHIIEREGGESLTRSDVKRLIMRDVLAKRGCYASPVEDAFRRLWPSVLRFVRVVNWRDFKRMLIVLQTIEARLVSERVCGLLSERLPPEAAFCPIHDCVLVPDGNQHATIATFADVSRDLGFPLAVELKRA